MRGLTVGGLGATAFMAITLGIGAVSAAPCAVVVAADVNQDGCVDALDLDEIDLWSGEPTGPSHPVTGRLDVNHDGIVNGLDYEVALDQYGTCQ